MTDNQPYHIPALLDETIEALALRPDGVYADATFGGGGHSRAILSHLGPEGHLYGFDRDRDAQANVPDDPRFTFILSDFRYMANFLRFHNAGKADGILADLGVSFHHFDTAGRGFSFRADAPLDMRMNMSAPRTAADIVNTASPEELTDIFRIYADLKRPAAIAAAIAKARQQSPVDTTARLCEAVAPLINPRQEKKDLAQIFQALRIEVNGEMDSLRALLRSSLEILRPGGRIAILTYHSIEDRIVKNFLKTGNLEGKLEKDFYGRVLTPWKAVTRQAVTASAEEIERNPRARSAKLRVAELTADLSDQQS